MDSGCVHVNFSGSKISASTLLSALITVHALREVKTNVCVCVRMCMSGHRQCIILSALAFKAMLLLQCFNTSLSLWKIISYF